MKNEGEHEHEHEHEHEFEFEFEREHEFEDEREHEFEDEDEREDEDEDEDEDEGSPTRQNAPLASKNGQRICQNAPSELGRGTTPTPTRVTFSSNRVSFVTLTSRGMGPSGGVVVSSSAAPSWA